MTSAIPAVTTGEHGSLLARSAQRSNGVAQPGPGRCCGVACDARYRSCRRAFSRRCGAPGRSERAANDRCYAACRMPPCGAAARMAGFAALRLSARFWRPDRARFRGSKPTGARTHKPSLIGADLTNVCCTSVAAKIPHRSEMTQCADFVAKVENRTTLKISRKLIFGLLHCCVAFQPRETRDQF